MMVEQEEPTMVEVDGKYCELGFTLPIIVLTHVDDMELYASNRDFKKLVEFLRSKGLKIKVEGPMDETEGSRSFLKKFQVDQ